MDIEQGNELIAKFMDYKYHEEYRDEYDEFHSDYWERPNGQIKDGLTFNTDWNEFMPAWAKFRRLRGLPLTEFEAHRKFTEEWIVMGNLMFAFEEFVKAIEWYNNNKIN